MMASTKEATDVILVANEGSHMYKPFKNRNLIFDTQAPVLGNSVFHNLSLLIFRSVGPYF